MDRKSFTLVRYSVICVVLNPVYIIANEFSSKIQCNQLSSPDILDLEQKEYLKTTTFFLFEHQFSSEYWPYDFQIPIPCGIYLFTVGDDVNFGITNICNQFEKILISLECPDISAMTHTVCSSLTTIIILELIRGNVFLTFCSTGIAGSHVKFLFSPIIPTGDEMKINENNSLDNALNFDPSADCCSTVHSWDCKRHVSVRSDKSFNEINDKMELISSIESEALQYADSYYSDFQSLTLPQRISIITSLIFLIIPIGLIYYTWYDISKLSL